MGLYRVNGKANGNYYNGLECLLPNKVETLCVCMCSMDDVLFLCDYMPRSPRHAAPTKKLNSRPRYLSWQWSEAASSIILEYILGYYSISECIRIDLSILGYIIVYYGSMHARKQCSLVVI